MKKGIITYSIISTFFVASSVMSMDLSEESRKTTFLSKEDSPPSRRTVPPLPLGKPSTSLSGPNSPRDTSSSVPRAQSELITRREKIRKEHESAFSLTFPDGSHTTDEIPSRRNLTPEEKEKITQGVAPFREQIEEADNALAALQELKKIEDRDSKSRSRSGSISSESGENDPDVTEAAQDILNKAGSSGLVTITARDGSRIQPYPKPGADDTPSQLPSDGTLRRFLDQRDPIDTGDAHLSSGQITPTHAALRELRDFKPEFEPETGVNPRIYDESESFSDEAEPTPKKAVTEKQQKQREQYLREKEDEELVRRSKEETERLRLIQEEEEKRARLAQEKRDKKLAIRLQKEQEEDAARLQRTPSEPNIRQAATETTTTEPTTLETTSIPDRKPTKLQLTAWCKQHPVIITVAGLSISLVTFLVLLYYLDKSDDVIQWLMSCSPKYNPSSHSSL